MIRCAPLVRTLTAVALAFAADAALHAPVAHAQIAAAIGKPLPSPDLPPGTVSVRVVAGSPSAPIAGTDVTLVVNGTPRVARSDSAGRAIFKDLPAGANIQAKVVDEDKKDITSDAFDLPGDSGVRVMLTTKPWNPGGGGGGGGAPFAGGAGGAMPEPRQMSGEPRPEQADAPGSFTVRLTYDDFKDAAPVGVPVSLLAYRYDDFVEVFTALSDKDGRAQFPGLDRSGGTSYFAMAQLPRNGTVDRLWAQPAVLDTQTGIRLILSSLKRDSKDARLDDLTRVEKQDTPTPAGKVRITLEGMVGPQTDVSIAGIRALSPGPDGTSRSERRYLGHGTPQVAAPDPTDIRASAHFNARPDAQAGTIDVTVHGGGGSDNQPMKDVDVKIAPAANPNDVISAKTADNGAVRIALKPARDLVAIVTINGKALTSKPFDVTKTGGTFEVEAHWPTEGKPEVVLDIAPQPDEVLYAETATGTAIYRSVPFQMLPDTGTRVSLFIYPRLLFSFSLTSHIDDQFLAVSGRFGVINNSWAPYRATADGLVVPLPKHFKGAIVAERDQSEVAVAPGEGYRVIRPIPPGERDFHGAFSLPVSGGDVTWSLDLPFGAFQSGMEVMRTPEMSIDTDPPGAINIQEAEVPQGKFFVMPQLQIPPQRAMVMTIHGLPHVESWKVWAPRVLGVFVIVMLGGALWFALRRKDEADAPARALRKQVLLDELVALQREGGNDKRRAEVMTELEQMWD